MILILGNTTASTVPRLTNTVNFTGKKVEDEPRGFLVFVGGHWAFIGCHQLFVYKKKSVARLCLILESPHKDEFDQYGNPLRPANGKTGQNIQEKITSRKGIINMLNPSFAYEVYLVNPIQYQASCYNQLKKQTSRSVTNQVFRKLFSARGFNLRADFINRLKKYSPNLIVNCCTSSLKSTVNVAIKEANLPLPKEGYIGDVHPSVW